MKLEKRLEVTKLFDYYGGLLPKKDREVLSLYFNEDYGLAEIAKLYNVSRQAIHYYIKKAAKRLGDVETKLGHLKMIDAAKKNLHKVNKCLEEVDVEKAKKLLTEVIDNL